MNDDIDTTIDAPSDVRTENAGTLVEATPVRTIVVNGRSHQHVGEQIGVRELARLAYPEQEGRPYAALTVAYEGGPIGASSGLMNGRTLVSVEDGQNFSVSLTDKS